MSNYGDAIQKYGERIGFERGLRNGFERGFRNGMERAQRDAIRSVMEVLNLTAQQAMEALEIPMEDRPKYEAQL